MLNAEFPPEDRDRVHRLIDTFKRRYGAPPSVVVSAPGRVNLIGEHADYNGLPVLPMAIDRSILIAAAPRHGKTIRLHNIDAAFAPRTYELSPSIPPFADGDWGNYHKAAVQGMLDHLAAAGSGGQGRRVPDWCGGDFLVEGNIPAGAGLSSSSACVVASALAFLAVNEVHVPFEELAELLPRAERYVGTLSGGMDQATSLLAKAGHALRIDFFPLRVRPVRFPEGVAVVACHSLMRAEKSAGARDAYNRRVIECRLACRALERALADLLPRRLPTMGDLVQMFPGRPLSTFVAPLATVLPEGVLTLREVAAHLKTTPERLLHDCAIPATMADEFAVLPRARHVLTEADRVNAGEQDLIAGDVAAFGERMYASHASCRNDYEVSCPELDELVAIAADAGALGARLTGAGFGGCTVNLVRAEDVPRFLAEIDRGFYRPRLALADDPARHRFVLQARGGASVTKMKDEW